MEDRKSSSLFVLSLLLLAFISAFSSPHSSWVLLAVFYFPAMSLEWSFSCTPLTFQCCVWVLKCESNQIKSPLPHELTHAWVLACACDNSTLELYESFPCVTSLFSWRAVGSGMNRATTNCWNGRYWGAVRVAISHNVNIKNTYLSYKSLAWIWSGLCFGFCMCVFSVQQSSPPSDKVQRVISQWSYMA